MNAFQKQGIERREHEAKVRRYQAKLAALRIQHRRDRLAMCQHQAVMRKADAIWLAPRGRNGAGMNRALLKRHWSARGLSGQPAEVVS